MQSKSNRNAEVEEITVRSEVNRGKSNSGKCMAQGPLILAREPVLWCENRYCPRPSDLSCLICFVCFSDGKSPAQIRLAAKCFFVWNSRGCTKEIRRGRRRDTSRHVVAKAARVLLRIFLIDPVSAELSTSSHAASRSSVRLSSSVLNP